MNLLLHLVYSFLYHSHLRMRSLIAPVRWFRMGCSAACCSYFAQIDLLRLLIGKPTMSLSPSASGRRLWLSLLFWKLILSSSAIWSQNLAWGTLFVATAALGRLCCLACAKIRASYPLATWTWGPTACSGTAQKRAKEASGCSFGLCLVLRCRCCAMFVTF